MSEPNTEKRSPANHNATAGIIMEPRNILYCGDAGIADGLMLSVLSLCNAVDAPLHIFVLTMSLKTPQKHFHPVPADLTEYLDSIVRHKNPQSRVSRIDASALFAAAPPAANMQTRFTPYCMLRLYADLLPQIPDRILYLDCDVLCRQDFSDFYFTDMGACAVGGVLDYWGRWFYRRKLFSLDYLNSGVLLLNMARIREENLFGACRSRCAQKEMFLPDQAALNALAEKKKFFPRKYNEQKKLHRDTVFQHFTTTFRFFPYFHALTVKPWQTERMHDVLGLHEYDGMLQEFFRHKAQYENQVRNEKE